MLVLYKRQSLLLTTLLLLLLVERSCSFHQQQQQQQQSTSTSTTATTTTIPTKLIGYDVRRKPVLIPLVGAGTWQYNDTIAYESLCKAFSVGITFVDTAFGYHNQYGVGRAIQDCFFNNNNNNNNNSTRIIDINNTNEYLQQQRQRRQLLEQDGATQQHQKQKVLNVLNERTRDELFVLTKVPGGLSGDETIAAHEINLKLLNLEYVDHVMVHYPADWDVTPSKATKLVRQDQWRALEDLYYTYRTRSIGISHYCTQHIYDILEIATVPISINQVEYHIGSGDIDQVIDTCRNNNITFMSFSPLCGPCQYNAEDSLIDGTLVTRIATKYNVTGAQVSLRFIIQQALFATNNTSSSVFGPVIPKSNNIDHIRTNMDLFSFTLSDDDMQLLKDTTRPPAEAGDCDVP